MSNILVVIDMQNDFVTGPLGTPEAVAVVDKIKEKLKTRSLIYQELYQRDVNRSMSDGY